MWSVTLKDNNKFVSNIYFDNRLQKLRYMEEITC